MTKDDVFELLKNYINKPLEYSMNNFLDSFCDLGFSYEIIDKATLWPGWTNSYIKYIIRVNKEFLFGLEIYETTLSENDMLIFLRQVYEVMSQETTIIQYVKV